MRLHSWLGRPKRLERGTIQGILCGPLGFVAPPASQVQVPLDPRDNTRRRRCDGLHGPAGEDRLGELLLGVLERGFALGNLDCDSVAGLGELGFELLDALSPSTRFVVLRDIGREVFQPGQCAFLLRHRWVPFSK